MYIKQVVIDGFKSYAQRTEIVGFDPLFNAITGLNGSGKSNILDAICFLLGISNLSQVRASNLQELVYKGGQAGITKATVTITFDNSDKKQSPLGYETYDEITVSRQIVIGGRNKYLINGSNATPSRVQDLFRSVQLNVNNPHFLIMQGRITKVLNMKPPEILAMIEEAAGTRMYESKRAAAQKTIEKKDSKLKEIETILEEEITPTLRKLKEERSSYLEYQKVVRELEHLSRLTVAFQFAEAEKCCKQSCADLEEMRAEIEGHRSQITESDARLQELDEAMRELERKQAEEAKGPVHELEKRLDECAKANALAEATLKNSKDTLSSEQKVLKGLKKGLDEDQSMLEAKSAELKAMEGAHTDIHDRSKTAEKAVQAAQHHFQAVTAGLSSNADGQDETLAAQKIACENDISTALSEKKQAEMRLKSAQSEIKEKERAFKDSEHSYDEDKAALSAAKSSIAKIEQAMGKMDYRDGLEEELIAKRDQLSTEVSELRRKTGNVESRFPQLQFEYQDPVPGFNKQKVKGPVAKLIRVKDMSAATALEVTAGGKLYNVVVDNEETGKQLLEKGRLKRRFTIIPLNKIASRSISDDVVKKAQSLVGRDKVYPAISLVGYEDELQPAMDYVFGSTFVCDSLQNAKKVTFDKQVMVRSVALAGDVFDPSGTLSGGSRPQTVPILTRLQELLECEQRLDEKAAELMEVTAELQRVQKVAGRYKELKEQREAKSHDVELIHTRINQSTHHQQLVQIQALKDAIAHQKEVLKASEDTEKRASRQLQDIQKKMKESKSHHERELKEAEESLARAKRDAEGVVKEAKEQQQEMHALRLEVEELQKGLLTQQEQISVCQQSIDAKSRQMEEHSLAEASAKDALKGAKQELEAQKANLKQMNKELQKLEAQWRDQDKGKASHALQIKELEHKIAKFQKDSREAAQRVEDLLAKYDWIATEKQFFGKVNTAYDFGAYNLKEASRKLSRLQEEKEALSKSVNMRAMNMLGKAEEKYNDLMKKKSIVENDKSKIGELILELDQKKNEALKGAHHRVNQDFGSIFSTLLPGASAKLSPSEGMTVLDGLEVKVAFGGVWKDSLTELSGGQRSLVALSLILSLLLFKPAPLYILDEIDAALDLSHTQNIGQMLRTHFRHSQFIVVSLKDGMFNNANVLFKTKFIDGVSTVTRYVNPRALTHRSDEGEPSGSGGHEGFRAMEEEQRTKGTKKTAKRARIDAPLSELATPLPAH